MYRAAASGALLALVAGLAWPAPAASQLSVGPAVLPLRSADTAVTAVFTVRNEGDHPLELRVVPSDFDQAASGEHHFQPFGSAAHSCAGHWQVFPEELALAGGEQADVRLRLDAGAPTCWGIVFVRHLPTSSGTRAGFEAGVKVYVTAPGAKAALQVSRLTVEPLGDSLRVTVATGNAGDAAVRADGRVELRSLAGTTLARSAIPPYSLLPDHTRTMSIVTRRFPAGHYVAVAVIDSGDDYLVGGQTAFAVP